MPEKDRILIAINQCDIAMKGENWLEDKPNEKLEEFLNQKVDSVKRRVFDSTGVNIEPIYYSAKKHYNMSKLLSFIVKYTPERKRVVYLEKINQDREIWRKNDELRNYGEEVRKDLSQSILGGVFEGAKIGGIIGLKFGPVGSIVGSIIGGLIGGITSFLGGLF